MIRKLFILFILVGLLGVGFSTVIGITTSNDNGVLRVTTDQGGLSNALIDGETVIVTGSGRLRGDIDVVSSQLKFSGVGTANDANAPFTNGARGTISSLTRIINTSSLIFETTASRHNIFVSEVSGGSEIIETGLLTNLFVYSQPDAVITDASFRNIKTHEVYRPFSKFFNVEYIDTESAQLNWEAGRLDRYGINIPSTTSGWFSWIGSGNGGNNAFWDWNPTSIDGTKIIHQNTNNDYYQGYTVSYNFLDKFSGSPVSDVRVVYKDDRTNVGGSLVERGEYFTDGTGVLTGTIDSLDLSVGSNIQRPILYVLTNQSRITSGTTNVPGVATSQNYVLDSITSKLLVRSYLHQGNLESLSLSSEVGKIDADLNVEEFSNYFLTLDSGISETNMATVMGYTTLDDLSTFYDRAKAEWRDNDDYPIFSGSSSVIDLGSTNLIVNSTSPSVYSYDLPSNTVTIKSNTFVKTAKFSVITTTGNVTIDSSVVNDLETVIPVAVNLTISGLPTVVGSNPLCKFTDNLNLNVSKVFADASGVATYSTFSDKSVTYVCDALGYERSENFVVNTGSLGLDEVLSLREYRDKNGFKLYGNGVAGQMALVNYLDNDKKFYLEYSGVNPIISYESFFDKTELIFSGTLGIDYDIDYDFSGGRFKINFGSPLKVSPKAGNTGDPEIDFVSYIESDSNPHTPYVTIGPLRVIYPIVDTTFEKDLDGEYNFLMDELKVLNIALNDSEVALLYKDQLRSLESSVVVTDYNSTSGDLDFDVTLAFIEKNENLICDFYYGKN